jgi:predicted nucleic acid-binding protein
MIRVFLDANVLFSAAYREGSGIVRLWENTSIHLITSPYALEEAERNIARKRPEASERLHGLAHAVEVSVAFRALSEAYGLPAKDLPILVAAVAAHCSVLLTGDIGDFGRLIGRTVEGARILTPGMFLAEL